MRHVKSYLNGTSIMDLARRSNYPPSLMARLIVENVTRPSPSSSSSSVTATIGTTAIRHDDGVDADNATEEAPSTASNSATDSNNTNNHHRGEGGVGGSSRRFLTNALRYPEKMLGDARASISPEYLFSERNGSVAAAPASVDVSAALPRRDVDREDKIDDRGGLHRERVPGTTTTTTTPMAIPLSRLSREVREAVDCDPMYGEFLRNHEKNWCALIDPPYPLSTAQW